MSPLPWWVKPVAIAALLGATFMAGMTVESWRRDSGELAEVKDAKARYVGAVKTSESTALKLQTELDRLAAAKPIITKELTRETRRIEYRCAMPDPSRLLYLRATKGDSTVARDVPNSVPSP
jgi:hypothetical protein